jgi:hypothetical protein
MSLIRKSKDVALSSTKQYNMIARRAMYSLMGVGLHGLNGVGPEVAIEQYKTYVLPTLLFGLEALHLTDKDTEKLSIFHRKNFALFTTPSKKYCHTRHSPTDGIGERFMVTPS